MMKNNLAACLAITLKHEGGFSNHPEDPGGATMKGVTLTTYRKYKPKATVADLKAITDSELQIIYRNGYWDIAGCDALPAGVDLAVFDYAVNSGAARAKRALADCATTDPSATIRALCEERLSFLKRLTTWGTFGRGWTTRVTDIRTKALAMAARPASPPRADPAPIPIADYPPPNTQPGFIARFFSALVARLANRG